MSSKFANHEELAFFKRRYEDWKAQGFPDIDAGLRPLLEKLNSFAGIATVSSCVGHRQTTLRPKMPFYIYCVCTEEGAQWLQHLYDQMAARLVEVLKIYTANDKLRSGQMPDSYKHVDFKDFMLVQSYKTLKGEDSSARPLLEGTLYHCWALQARGTHLNEPRSNLLKELLSIMERLQTAAEFTTSTVIDRTQIGVEFP